MFRPDSKEKEKFIQVRSMHAQSEPSAWSLRSVESSAVLRFNHLFDISVYQMGRLYYIHAPHASSHWMFEHKPRLAGIPSYAQLLSLSSAAPLTSDAAAAAAGFFTPVSPLFRTSSSTPPPPTPPVSPRLSALLKPPLLPRGRGTWQQSVAR